MHEKALIAAFERVVSEDHPNPDRADCPGTEVIQQFVLKPEMFTGSLLLDHFHRCAPCLQELKKIHEAHQQGAKIA